MLVGKPQEAQAIATCPLRCKEWAPGQRVQPGQGRQLQSPKVCLPPGFKSPPLDVPLIGIPDPDEVLSILTLIGTMNVVLYKNEAMGDLKHEYKTLYLEPLCPESPNQGPTITKLWAVEWVIYPENFV